MQDPTRPLTASDLAHDTTSVLFYCFRKVTRPSPKSRAGKYTSPFRGRFCGAPQQKLREGWGVESRQSSTFAASKNLWKNFRKSTWTRTDSQHRILELLRGWPTVSKLKGGGLSVRRARTLCRQGRSLGSALWPLRRQERSFLWPGGNLIWKNYCCTIPHPPRGWISVNILLVQRSVTEKNRSEILSLGLLLPSSLAAGNCFSLPVPSVCFAALFQINLLFFK